MVCGKPDNRGREKMQKIQVIGVHHITLMGADRQTSIDFWEGLLGMPFHLRSAKIWTIPTKGTCISIPATAG